MVDRKFCQYIFCNIFIGFVAQSSRLLYISPNLIYDTPCSGLPSYRASFNILQEELEDTKRVIRIRISKKKRQHNGQKKKLKRTNNNPQNIHVKLNIE